MQLTMECGMAVAEFDEALLVIPRIKSFKSAAEFVASTFGRGTMVIPSQL